MARSCGLLQPVSMKKTQRTNESLPLQFAAAYRRVVRRTFNVRFGSKADICIAKRHVRVTPKSDRESRFPQKGMSALPLKADIRSAQAHVRFGPIADIERLGM